jgi:hypothetical protein
MVMSTYNNVLDITFTSNDAVLPQKDANQFLERAIQKLSSLIEEETIPTPINTVNS